MHQLDPKSNKKVPIIILIRIGQKNYVYTIIKLIYSLGSKNNFFLGTISFWTFLFIAIITVQTLNRENLG